MGLAVIDKEAAAHAVADGSISQRERRVIEAGDATGVRVRKHLGNRATMHRARGELGDTDGASHDGAAAHHHAVGDAGTGFLQDHGAADGDLVVNVAHHTAVKSGRAAPQIDRPGGDERLAVRQHHEFGRILWHGAVGQGAVAHVERATKHKQRWVAAVCRAAVNHCLAKDQRAVDREERTKAISIALSKQATVHRHLERNCKNGTPSLGRSAADTAAIVQLDPAVMNEDGTAHQS
eukprot:6206338-Pleurochrysis_carterae.AAC.3